MTAHVDEIILAHRDELRDEATQLYVGEHMRECADCRDLERKVERADHLLRLPEAAVALPPRTAPAPSLEPWVTAPRVAVAGLAVLVAVGIGTGLRQVASTDDPGPPPPAAVAQPGGAASPGAADLAGTLAGVAIGMDGAEVRAILGEPDRTSPFGVQWTYDRGLILHFAAGPLADPVGLTSIFASPASGARTGEGFAVDGTEQEFRAIYPVAVTTATNAPVTTHYVAVTRNGRTTLSLRATFGPSGRAVSVLLIDDDRVPTIPLPVVRIIPTATGQPLVIGPYQPFPDWREALETDLRSAQDELTFVPLVADYMPIEVRADVRPRDSCGLATRCVQYILAVSSPQAFSVTVLQGPAGCCLDAARPNAQRDIEIRPGVFAQFIPNQPHFGGPILWWTEETAPGSNVYVAVSGPLLDREELVKIARSMRPLGAP